MKVKASQSRSSSSKKKSIPEGVIDHSPYISLKLKRVQVFLLLPNSGVSSYNSFYGKISEIITGDSKYYTVGYSIVQYNVVQHSLVLHTIVQYRIAVNTLSTLIERIENGFGRFKHFKISAAQDKHNFGNCASLSRYVKKCYNVMILTRVRWFCSLIEKP